MIKQKIVLIAAIVAGVLAFVLSGAYLRGERARLSKGAESLDVVVAAHDLPAGSVLKKDDLLSGSILKRQADSRVIRTTEFREIIGKKLLFSIDRGKAILWTDVDVPLKGEGGLAETITPQMRAVSISVDAVASVSAMVKPNDRVDVLGTFTLPASNGLAEVETVTLTMLQDVTVLAVGQTMAKKMPVPGERTVTAPKAYNTITFEVTPREAELLVFAQSVRGHLTLTLRHPTDVSYLGDLPTVDFEHVRTKLKELNMIRQRDIRHKTEIP